MEEPRKDLVSKAFNCPRNRGRPNALMFRELEPDVVSSLKEVLEWSRDRHAAQGLDFQPKDLKADPIVVALARITGSTVVCEEFPPRGSQGRPKIPDYCQNFGIPCIRTVQLIQAMGWQLNRR